MIDLISHFCNNIFNSKLFVNITKIYIDNYIVLRYSFITVADITSNDTSTPNQNFMKGAFLMPESNERGALTEAVYYILLSLYQPMHGYGIMQNVSALSHGRVNLGPGTLYGAINTLLEKHLIESFSTDDKSRKKQYIITTLGKEIIISEIERLNELIMNGNQIVKENVE